MDAATDDHAHQPPQGDPTGASKNIKHLTALEIFVAVARDFRDSLPSKEQKLFQTFQTQQSMVEEIQKDVRTYQNSRKLSLLCKKVERFSTPLAPYFEVVSITIQSNPEFAALAWGAIRLLGSNYTIFLEKMINMFEEIGDRLPAYGEYYELVRKRKEATNDNSTGKLATETSNDRLCKALSYLYADIMEFCQEAYQLFSANRKGVRHNLKVISNLFWKPFDTRFSNLLGRLKSHQALFRNEMQPEESRFLQLQFARRESEAQFSKDILEDLRMRMKKIKTENDEK
ncbi:uncharacterized protein LY89DRAFT_742377 [Mollisia scopiformis]|uniref:DUF7708 domain-containing protein n=1 Tax=Mollisia scopiformis TaxID=149040 RepID=A0A132B6P6_MOLSC|nr:uncharacterized protein LY89DRAFT_742377 [Mollisia scopiformis]KUJ08082.1 hypothetical protein LY89DRAFT_742377 [Mollisia scopiformis]